MRRTHPIVVAAALVASLLAAPVAAEPSREVPQSRETAVGRLIAEQGNQALSQIRRELRVMLHDQRPRTAVPGAQLSRSSQRVASPMHVAASVAPDA